MSPTHHPSTVSSDNVLHISTQSSTHHNIFPTHQPSLEEHKSTHQRGHTVWENVLTNFFLKSFLAHTVVFSVPREGRGESSRPGLWKAKRALDTAHHRHHFSLSSPHMSVDKIWLIVGKSSTSTSKRARTSRQSTIPLSVLTTNVQTNLRRIWCF